MVWIYFINIYINNHTNLYLSITAKKGRGTSSILISTHGQARVIKKRKVVQEDGPHIFGNQNNNNQNIPDAGEGQQMEDQHHNNNNQMPMQQQPPMQMNDMQDQSINLDHSQ